MTDIIATIKKKLKYTLREIGCIGAGGSTYRRRTDLHAAECSKINIHKAMLNKK